MFFDRIFNFLNGNNNMMNRSSNSFRRNNRCSCYSYKLVPFEQARNMIEMGEVLLIDVRTESEYRLMHIKNAINIPIDIFESKIMDGTINNSKTIMVYCSSGSRSKKAIQLLNRFGYNICIWEYAALATFPYRDMLIYDNN